MNCIHLIKIRTDVPPIQFVYNVKQPEINDVYFAMDAYKYLRI
jgi:hypothetical protein